MSNIWYFHMSQDDQVEDSLKKDYNSGLQF